MDASRRISLTRVSKSLRLVSISTGLSIPKSRHAKGVFSRRRNHARTFVLSLNERRITSSVRSPFILALLDQERKRSRPIILGQSHVEPSRAAELSFAHLQTDWANGVKITGAGRSLLTCLVRWARP